MTKIELQTKREQLKADLAVYASDKSTEASIARTKIQAELTLVNAQIKSLNVSEAAQLKADADVKAKLGMAEHQANMTRSVERLTPTKPMTPKPLSQGEYILVQAKRLRDAIARIKPENREVFTGVMLLQLETFVEEQKKHVKAYNAKLALAKATEPTDEAWRETWKDP